MFVFVIFKVKKTWKFFPVNSGKSMSGRIFLILIYHFSAMTSCMGLS